MKYLEEYRDPAAARALAEAIASRATRRWTIRTSGPCIPGLFGMQGDGLKPGRGWDPLGFAQREGEGAALSRLEGPSAEAS